MLNMGSTDLGLCTVSGPLGPNGLTAPEAVEEGSCTESGPAPAQGIHTHKHTLV